MSNFAVPAVPMPPPPPPPPAPPSDPALRASTEQAAVHCATNPGFVHALRAASAAAGSLSDNNTTRPSTSPYQFMVDPTSDGYAYFNWYLRVCQQQLASSGPPGVPPPTPNSLPPPPPPPPPHQSFHTSSILSGLPPNQPVSYHTGPDANCFSPHSSKTDEHVVPQTPASPFHTSNTDFAAHSSNACLFFPTPYGHGPVPAPSHFQPFPLDVASNAAAAFQNNPSSADHIAQLAAQFAEPPLPSLTSFESVSIDKDPKMSGLLQRTSDFIRNASVRLIGCGTLDAGLTAILLLYPPFVAASPDYQAASQLLRLRAEETQSFVGRLSISLLSYVLMTTGNVKMEWRTQLLPHFFWILRLAYIAGDSPQEKCLIRALIHKAFESSVITAEQRSAFSALLETPRIPGVSDAFNTPLISTPAPQQEKRRKFRFDAGAPPPPPPTDASKPDVLITSAPTLIDAQERPMQAPPPPPLLPPLTSPGLELLTAPASTHNHQVTGFFSLPFVPSRPATIAPIGTGDPQALLAAKAATPSTIDPDRISGGILATLLKQVSKRGRHLQAAFVPYRPLDPFLIPAASPLSVSAPTDYLIDRLADLQDDIDAAFATIASEEARNKSATVSRGGSTRLRRDIDDVDKPKEEDLDLQSTRVAPKKKRATREFRERGSGLTSYGEASWEKPVAWAQAEMGIAEDGSLLSDSGAPRVGLGASSKSMATTSAADDLFNDYRKQRAHKYHKTIAQAHADRAQEELQDPSRLCFICQKSGHLARECKFGLT